MITDENLIYKYQQLGDIESLNQLVHRYLKRTYIFFSTRINNRDDVEDLVQNVFLKLTQVIISGKKIKSFKDYLFICCRNTFRDYLRQKKTGAIMQSSDVINGIKTVEFLSFSGWEKDKDLAQVSIEHLEKALKACIVLFPTEKIRNVIWDNVFGYSLKEIATRNDCPINTAASIWHRHKKKLFQCVLKKIGLL